jgi:hypothetical protein
MTLTRGVGLTEKEREKRKGCRVDGLRLGWPSWVGSRAVALLDPGSAQLLCFFFFVLISFSIFAANCFVLFEKAKIV